MKDNSRKALVLRLSWLLALTVLAEPILVADHTLTMLGEDMLT